MRWKCSIFILILQINSSAFADNGAPDSSQCELSYITKDQVSQFKFNRKPIQSLTDSINEGLKKSFHYINTLDYYTLGLASSLTLSHFLSSKLSLEDIKPNQWNQLTMKGHLVYRDSPFTFIPVRAAKIKVQSEDKYDILTTGAKGEYSGYFYKWVSYERFRLLPFPIFEFKSKVIKTLNVPVKIQIDSKFCKASTTIHRIPTEPITFVLSRR